MPDEHDHYLELDIRHALKHGPVSMATRKFVRGLSEGDLDYLCWVIAEELWRARWRRLPPDRIGSSAPGAPLRSDSGGPEER